MKKFIEDFKKFISRGNVLDMAVGVIIGAAFSAIVTAFTDKVIMPLINLVLTVDGDKGLESAYTFLKRVTLSDGTVDLANSIYIDWGSFITAVINFFIIAMTLFIIIKIATRGNRKLKDLEGKLHNFVLTSKDFKELKARGVKITDRAKVQAYREEKINNLKLEKERLELEAKQKEAEDRKNNPTERELLKEIRDLLIAQKQANEPTENN